MNKKSKGTLNGYKDIIMENFNLILVVLLIGLMLSVMGIMAQVSDNNKFSDEAGNIISRYGGTTQEAHEEINNFSQETFNGRYKVLSEDTSIYKYGEKIEFMIEGKIKVFFFEIPVHLKYKGNTISKVRL